MPKNIQRQFDQNNGGGVITNVPQSNVFANSQLVAVQGSTGTGHAECFSSPPIIIHCAGVWQTTTTTPNVFVNNIPVTATGDVDTCGHSRIIGSPNVFVG